MKVNFTYKRGGKVKRISEPVAKLLQKRGVGTYQTGAVDSYQTRELRADPLDALDAEALHKLAQERGVKVHHRAGADKVRAALRAYIA